MSIETASVPAIDMRAITQLAESDELGEQFVAEIIGVFLTDLTERVHAIGLQMSHDDRAGIAATAHAVKGSCGHFGAVRSIPWSRKRNGSAPRWKLIDPTICTALSGDLRQDHGPAV